VAGIFAYDCDRDVPALSIPRAEVHLVVRFGPAAGSGLDVHAFGGRQKVHRKLIRSGQRSVTARLRLGLADAVLGVPASAIAGRIVLLEDLWGEAAAWRLRGRLAEAGDQAGAARILEGALAERLARAAGPNRHAPLAIAAAARLPSAQVRAVADDLGVSERHLRRVFRDSVGMSPKEFTKLTRFQRALSAAREGTHASWASIATLAGYYDQAHLIAEFRAIAGVTPRAFLDELRAAPSLV
jgi:AraC-like DNA-binding protein